MGADSFGAGVIAVRAPDDPVRSPSGAMCGQRFRLHESHPDRASLTSAALPPPSAEMPVDLRDGERIFAEQRVVIRL